MSDQALPGLDSPAERRFHERFQAVSKAGRIVLLLILVAVALGIAGTGPLSWAEVEEGDLLVRYERFARHGATWTLEVESASVDGPVNIVIDRGFHAGQQLEAVVPEPTSVTVSDRFVTYEFETTAAPATLQFRWRADAIWGRSSVVGIEDGPQVSFVQFVYP